MALPFPPPSLPQGRWASPRFSPLRKGTERGALKGGRWGEGERAAAVRAGGAGARSRERGATR